MKTTHLNILKSTLICLFIILTATSCAKRHSHTSNSDTPILSVTEEQSTIPHTGRLTGVNWFGFETSSYVTHGLWTRDYKSMLQQIADLGFNTVRIPWSNEMLGKDPIGIQYNDYGVDGYTQQQGLNSDLKGLSSLAVLKEIIEYAETVDLYIILDNHSRHADDI